MKKRAATHPASRQLLSWYEKNGRDLPWRHTRDPYKILVSEFMLQQTQVSRGLIFYDRWLKRFPDWQSLAEASNADVLKEWSGLGYNRRALMLRDIARQIVELGVPSDPEGWKKLKGIGDYTAAAICAFALKQRTLPIDTNIRRVLARVLFGIPYPALADDERISKQADSFLPKTGNFYDVPQALFDLAVSICTKIPNCAACPLRDECKSAPKFLAGNVRVERLTKKPLEKKHRNKPHPDRIYRGKILELAKNSRNGVEIKKIGPLIDPKFSATDDETWVRSMINRMEKDGMVEQKSGRIRLSQK